MFGTTLVKINLNPSQCSYLENMGEVYKLEFRHGIRIIFNLDSQLLSKRGP